MTNLLIDNPDSDGPTFIFSHGAGAHMDSDFMNFFAQQLCKRGIKVVRFEFDYMETRRKTGSKRPPDRLPKLIDKYLKVIKSVNDENIFIGGKSMGGRIASMIASQKPSLIRGCICLGYPFHPPGKPEKLRTDHLMDIKTNTLICQGERDSFGTREEVNNYKLSQNIEVFWLNDGDHGFKPRKKSGFTEEGNWMASIDKITEWINYN